MRNIINNNDNINEEYNREIELLENYLEEAETQAEKEEILSQLLDTRNALKLSQAINKEWSK